MVMEYDGFTTAADDWLNKLIYEEFKTASKFVSFETLGKEVDKKSYPGWQVMPVRVNEPGSHIIDLKLLQYRH